MNLAGVDAGGAAGAHQQRPREGQGEHGGNEDNGHHTTCDDGRIMFVLLLCRIGGTKASHRTPAGTRGADRRAQLHPRSALCAAKLSVGSGRALPRVRGTRSIHSLYFRDSRKAGVCKPRTARVTSVAQAQMEKRPAHRPCGRSVGRRASVGLRPGLCGALAVGFLR